jgi:ABC-type antimicrobial peptide transport system permease subunit
MFKNYFIIAYRSLLRNKGFSATNILSLTIGIACTIFIFLWVQDELGYDKFHKNFSSIYQVIAHRKFNNQVFTDRNMVMPLAKELEKSSPQIKNAVFTTYRQAHILTYGDSKLKKYGYTVSEHFFDMFSWKFIKGNASTAIPDAYSIVLTQSAARSLFGEDDPIGKVVKIDNSYDSKVTAVVADNPGNSTFQFDFINSFNYSGDSERESMTNWSNSSWNVFVQLTEGADRSSLEKNINEIKYQHDPNDKKISTYFTFPMSQWRLYSDFKDGKNVGGMVQYVRLFSIIALIILLIACVNFMNLATARSEKRAKEVGVRKTLGSDKKQLILQFFLESIILSFIAFVFSLLTVYLLLPSFNSLVDKHLTLDFAQPFYWLGSLMIIIGTGVLAGSYPALYLSSFNPVRVLKGVFLPGKKAALPRRILVVGQFAITIILISATLIVYRQINHIKHRDIGYNPNNLIMIPVTPETQTNFAVIKQELLSTGLIDAVTRTSSPITNVWWRMGAPNWDGKPAGGNLIVAGFATDIDFSKTMGIKILEGRDFTGWPLDSTSMLLNQAAVDAMGLKKPIGMQMRFNRSFTVVGITNNVVMETPYKPVDPMIMFFNPNNAATISIRLNQADQTSKALKSIESIFTKYNPAYPFEYQFVDQEFGRKFIAEELISKITNIFASLAIFICCLGLAGLAAFTIEKRIREIGMRKVLGASVQQVLILISKDFLKLVLIAFILAVPFTWWFMNNWLDKYAYRVNITLGLFGLVGFLLLILTLCVVSLKTMKAAIANPIKTLRTNRIEVRR